MAGGKSIHLNTNHSITHTHTRVVAFCDGFANGDRAESEDTPRTTLALAEERVGLTASDGRTVVAVALAMRDERVMLARAVHVRRAMLVRVNPKNAISF